MQISPIPTLSDEINKIRTKTANIVAEQIIPNEKEIYKGGDTAKTIRAEIRETVKSGKFMGASSPRRIWWNGNRFYGACIYE